MSIEEKLLKLMEAKKDSDKEDPTDANADKAKDPDAGDQTADRVDQEPAVSIENPIDPDLKSSESAKEDPDGDPDEQDQDRVQESAIEESTFTIDGTEEAKDTIGHGDWTIHHLTKPGHTGASIVARHSDGKTKSINIYTGNREGADNLMQHPSHLKKMVDIATGKMEESTEIQDFVKEEELSEEFQLKVSTLFEAKVSEKVSMLVEEKTTQLEEEYKTRLDEAVQVYENELTDKIDGYFGKLSEQWMHDNELALEASIRSELTESFMNGMKQLFESHYIDIPVEKFDIVNSLEEQLKASKDELSTAQQLLEEQRSDLNKANREIILENSTKGMTDIDSGKFRSIMEDFEYETSDLFTKRAEIIKESFFGQNKKEVSNLSGKKLDISSKNLTEETQLDAKIVSVDTNVKQYADFIRKTSVKK
jgi:DNA-binding transcriptional MerR regulator